MKIRLATALLVTTVMGGCAVFRESHPAAPTKLVALATLGLIMAVYLMTMH